MSRSLLIFLSLFCCQIASAKSPLFKLCAEKLEDPAKVSQCSEEAMLAFTQKASRFISKSLGLYCNETVTAQIKLKENGSLRVRSIDSRYTTLLEDEVKAWLELLDGKLLPTPDGEDKFELVFQFEVPSQEETDWRETDNLPTKKHCQDLNGVAKRSCLLDAFQEVIGDLHHRGMQAYSETEVILTSNGQFMGIRFKSPVTRAMKKVNDSIALRFARLKPGRLTYNGPYSSSNIRIDYTYDHFMSAPHRRHFFQEMGPELLKQVDTTEYINNLVQSASDFHQYKHFITYLKEVISATGIAKSNKYGYWAQLGTGTLDSLFNDHYYFDERTTRRLKRSFMPVRHLQCPEDDSLGECSVSLISRHIQQYTLKTHHINLGDERFANPEGPLTKYSPEHIALDLEVGLKQGFIGIRLFVDEKGKLMYIDPYIQSHSPMYEEFLAAKKNGSSDAEAWEILNKNLSFLMIDAISQIPEFKPASWGDRPCKSSPSFFVKIGPED